MAPSLAQSCMGTRERRSRTWTHHLDRGSVEGAHAVEFSKTVAPLQEGASFPQARPRTDFRPRSGPLSIAPNPGREAGPRKIFGPPLQGPRIRAQARLSAGSGPGRAGGLGPVEPAGSRRSSPTSYETIWTVTVRLRGRSSKSIRTTCCQVPSASSPSTSGIVSDGPITAARRWAWALVS